MRHDDSFIPAKTDTSPSLIHFFWTGKMPSKKLQRHLLHWQHYLSHQNSEFRVCLWMTGDLHEGMQQDNNAKMDTDGDLTIGTPAIKIRNIDPLFAEAAVTYPELTAVCRKLIAAKLYSFVSSFARMLILNAFPGFYCDTDIYPTTTPDIHFPATLNALRAYYRQNNTHPVFCYYNGICIENQIMLSLHANAFSSRLEKRNTEIAGVKSDPQSPFSDVDAFISANQTAIDKLKSILSDDPFLRKGARWIADFKKPRSHREKETYTVSTNQEIVKIKQAVSLFQLFYQLSIKYYDAKSAEQNFPILYNVMQCYFHNPTQDRNNVYAWSHPIHFHLERLRQSANVLGERYKKRIVTRGNARLFSEPRIIPPTANVSTLHTAVAERDWHYAFVLAQAFQTQLSSDAITHSLSSILAENSPFTWKEAQLRYVNFLCDHCNKEDEIQQAIMSAVIKLALSRAEETESTQLVVNTLKDHISCWITSAEELEKIIDYLNQEDRIALFNALKERLPDLFPFYADVTRLSFKINETEEIVLSTLLLESLESANGKPSDSLQKAIATHTEKMNAIALHLSAENSHLAKRLLSSPARLSSTALNHIATLADHLSQPELVQFILSPQKLSDVHFSRIVQKLKFSTLSEDLLDKIVLHASTINHFDFGFLAAQPDFSAIHFFAEHNLHGCITPAVIGDGKALQQVKKNTHKTPIELAATEEHWQTVQKIASLHSASPGDPECYCYALVHAANAKQWATCKTLIEKGAALVKHFKINTINGLYPVHMFISGNQRELVKLILTREPTLAHCTANNSNKRLIEYAADNDRWEIVADIATLNPRPANESVTYGSMLLLAAAKNEWLVCLKLIHQGAYLERREASQGYKPIHFFAAAGKWDLLETALLFKADRQKTTDDGRNIQQIAADHGHHALLQKMEEHSFVVTSTADPFAVLRGDIIAILNTAPMIRAIATRPESSRTAKLFQKTTHLPLTTAAQLSLLVRYASTPEYIQRHLERVHSEAIATIPTQEAYVACLTRCITVVTLTPVVPDR